MSLLTIVVDTREQQPWAFPADQVKVIRGTLKSGDYSLEGDSSFSIERKNLEDFVGTISSGWPRFCKQLIRMKSFPAQIIIVEAAMIEIIGHEYNHPKVLPKFVMKRIAQLSLDGVSVLFVSNHFIAAGMCISILRERSRRINGGGTTQDKD